MATVHQHIEAPPAAVFELLADGWNYSQWVVGTSHVRSVDADWPQPGSRLHHAAGAWPLVVRDHTEMRELEPNRRLLMTAKGWPFGEAEVEIVLAPEDSGTDLTLREHGTGGAGRLLRNPIGDRLIHRRNTESVARLAALAERRTQLSRGFVGRSALEPVDWSPGQGARGARGRWRSSGSDFNTGRPMDRCVIGCDALARKPANRLTAPRGVPPAIRARCGPHDRRFGQRAGASLAGAFDRWRSEVTSGASAAHQSGAGRLRQRGIRQVHGTRVTGRPLGLWSSPS